MSTEQPASARQTYVHDFGHGLRAVLTLDISALRSGMPVHGALEIRWSGPRPRSGAGVRAVMRQYCEWKAGILQAVADETGLRILDTTQVAADQAVVRRFVPRGDRGSPDP